MPRMSGDWRRIVPETSRHPASWAFWRIRLGLFLMAFALTGYVIRNFLGGNPLHFITGAIVFFLLYFAARKLAFVPWIKTLMVSFLTQLQKKARREKAEEGPDFGPDVFDDLDDDEKEDEDEEDMSRSRSRSRTKERSEEEVIRLPGPEQEEPPKTKRQSKQKWTWGRKGR